MSLATHQQLPPHFNVIPFLTVHDPEADIKNMVRADIYYHLGSNSCPVVKSICFSSISCSVTQFVFKHSISGDLLTVLRFPRCQDEPFRDDLCPVSSPACTSSRFRPHTGKRARHGEVRSSLTLLSALLNDILMSDISTSTSHLWLPQKMSRYCTTFLGKRRLSVTQNHTFTARFANLRTPSIPEREMIAPSESLRSE
jgi:hypothetical protein